MKLHKLEIKNIASIEEATIDFEAKPLSDSNVFLITGETGSGKSTILDAICLALYATTPRMRETEMDGSDIDDMKVTDTQQLMRKNTKEAYARLSFLGSDGNEYESEWSVERKTKNLTRLWRLKNITHPDHSPAEANGLLLKNGDGSGDKNNAIVKIIRESAVGLSFDQFCRTTMLAQGEFTRFLKCGKKEKAAILEKITNTENYAKIGAKIFELTGKYKSDMDAVDPKKTEQPLPPEQRKQLDDEIRELGRQIDDIKNQLEILVPQYNWLTQEAQLKENQKKGQGAWQSAKEATKTSEYRQLAKDIEEYNLSGDARQWLAAINLANREIQQAIIDIAALNIPGGTNLTEEEIKAQQSLTNGLIANIRVAKIQVSAYFQAKDQRDKLKKSLTDRQIDLGKKESQLKQLEPQVEKAKKEFEDYDADYEKLNLAVDKLAAKLRESIQEGGKCPICGQVVASKDILPHEDDLQKIVRDAKKKRDDAKSAYDGEHGVKTQYDTLFALIKAEKESLEKEQRNFDNDQSLETSKSNAVGILGKCGIAWSDNKETIEDSLVAKNNEAKKQQDNDGKLLQWIGFNATKIAAENRKQTNQGQLIAFQNAHPELTDERLDELQKLDILAKSKKKEAIDQALSSAKGALDGINTQLQEHTKNKPQKWIDGKDIESLKAEIGSLNNQVSPLSSAKGAKDQQQKTDDERNTNVQRLKTLYDQKKQVFENWNKLCNLVGDKYGDKFRIIAQSYILGNLINAANEHMRTLTDRYVLHVVPGRDLIIMVEDHYQGGVMRAASNISGGEGFIVSLALALALSEIGQSLKVEMLFIDEGFGTLSGAPLMNAINTLESLHDTNNRQVCAISHREEVKERIPVQIQVNQASQSSASTIEIVPKLDD